jgi:hypothetical protein
MLYWTCYSHHQCKPFPISLDGKSAYLAYLYSSEAGVHIQQVDPSTFAAVDDAVSVSTAKEAINVDCFVLNRQHTFENFPLSHHDMPLYDMAPLYETPR